MPYRGLSSLAMLLAMSAGLLACTTTQQDDHCVLPVMRDAGMGVQVESCAAWEFGPSREQREQFDKSHGTPAGNH